jgi:hypothetical protein
LHCIEEIPQWEAPKHLITSPHPLVAITFQHQAFIEVSFFIVFDIAPHMEKMMCRGGVFHPAEQRTSVRYSISAPAVPEKKRKYPGHAGHHHESKKKKRKSFVQVKVTQYVRSLAKQTPVSSTKSRSSSSEQSIFRSRSSSDGGKGGAKQLKLHTYCIELGTCSGHR